MKKLRKILLLVLVAALLSVSVLAATGVVDAKLTYRDIKITLDGETVDEFVDSGSDVVTPDNAQERLDTLKTQLH